jgi:hypothetical protein
MEMVSTLALQRHGAPERCLISLELRSLQRNFGTIFPAPGAAVGLSIYLHCMLSELFGRFNDWRLTCNSTQLWKCFLLAFERVHIGPSCALELSRRERRSLQHVFLRTYA